MYGYQSLHVWGKQQKVLHWTESNYLCRHSIFYQPISNFVRVDHSGIWKELTRVTAEQCKSRMTEDSHLSCSGAGFRQVKKDWQFTAISPWVHTTKLFEIVDWHLRVCVWFHIHIVGKILSSIIPRIPFLDRFLLLPATADMNLALELRLPLCIVF